jgi:curved DNA-binding protein CbpA
MARAEVTDDYYSILEVSQLASLDTIREAYKRLALRFHPDKNRDVGATRDFQRLVVAWETLKDEERRRVYDRDYSSVVRSRYEEVVRRREEVDREVTANWNQSTNHTPYPDEAIQREKARTWKGSVKKDYILRLESWTIFRDSHLLQIKDRQTLLRRNYADLEAQQRVPEVEMIRMFQQAIERSRQIGHKIQDSAATLSGLLAARQSYINTMTTAIRENQARITKLLSELETERRRYEDAEGVSREFRVQQALEILGPRYLNPPLFCMIDRRGQAINRWKALSRVKPGVKLFTTIEAASENPWHGSGKWERIGGEHACQRCEKPAFHFVIEVGPARCPGCGTIVCHNCDRDLQLLREYDQWIRGPLDDPDSFFALEFGGACEGPKKAWVNTPSFASTYEFAPAL